MKHQAIFSSKDKRKEVKVLSAAVFVWHLKINIYIVLKYERFVQIQVLLPRTIKYFQAGIP